MRHYENKAVIDATARDVFAYVDDHEQFSSHMRQSSWMMGGGHMEETIDDGRGRQIGSHIRMSGKVFGLTLSLDEIVTAYEPPRRKSWGTVGDVRLMVIGPYRMSLKVNPQEDRALLQIAIDYELPSRNAWLGRMFGRIYATWCVRQMLSGVENHFTAIATNVRSDRQA